MCVHMCVYTYACMCVDKYVCTYVCTYVCMCVDKCVCTYVFLILSLPTWKLRGDI